MQLELKKWEKAKFYFLVKVFMYEYGDNGIVMEKENGQITLYATNGAHNTIYCTIPMGSTKELWGQTYVICAPDNDHILVDAGPIKVIINYTEQVATIRKEDCEIFGSKAWGEDVQVEWDEDFEAYFA